MNRNIDTNLSKVRRLYNFYNAIPNLIWSVVGLLPISIFCYDFIELKYIYIFLAISVFAMFLPSSFLDIIQLSKTTATYKKLGVHLVNRVSQNGDWINRLVRKQYPNFKVVTFNAPSAKKLLQQTYIYEKFHFGLFLFFCLTTVYAASRKYFIWAFIITLTNLVYNIYPNLLQQYIRIKLKLYNQRLKPN